VLTGYGADIPLGGMHRDTVSLGTLDAVLAADMDGFDGLNEMVPALSGIAGHWSTHPYWDRDVLDLLISLEPGLKRRAGSDKWVLREAFRSALPGETVRRRKLGSHEGSGTTSTWTRLLRESGVPADRVREAKLAQAWDLHRRLVDGDEHPAALTAEAIA
jgi:(carboxyethyl)arginine beta-lactam-synthase